MDTSACVRAALTFACFVSYIAISAHASLDPSLVRGARATTYWGRTQGCLPLDASTSTVLCSDPDQPQQAAQFCLTTRYCQCNRSNKWAVSGRTTFFGVAGGRNMPIYVYTVKVQVFNANTKALINTTYANCQPNTAVRAYSSLECDYRALINPLPNNQGYGVYPVLNTCCNRPCQVPASASASVGSPGHRRRFHDDLAVPEGSNLLTVVPDDSVASSYANTMSVSAAAVPNAISACDPSIC